MKIFGQDITRDMMPGYTDFKQDPYRLYQLMQQQLSSVLNNNQMPQQMPQQMQATGPDTQEQRSNQWQ